MLCFPSKTNTHNSYTPIDAFAALKTNLQLSSHYHHTSPINKIPPYFLAIEHERHERRIPRQRPIDPRTWKNPKSFHLHPSLAWETKQGAVCPGDIPNNSLPIPRLSLYKTKFPKNAPAFHLCTRWWYPYRINTQNRRKEQAQFSTITFIPTKLQKPI